MWIQQSDRKHLLEVLGGSASRSDASLSSIFPPGEVRGDDLFLVWQDNPAGLLKQPSRGSTKGNQSLPTGIITADGKLRDFLAWSSTFLTGFKPITAYYRVMEMSTARSYQVDLGRPSLAGFESAVVGTIIGEFLALAPEMRDTAELTPVACAATLSFCLARALALGYDADQMEAISQDWTRARSLTGQNSALLKIGTVKSIWKMLAAKRDSNTRPATKMRREELPRHIAPAYAELLSHGKISRNAWLAVIGGVGELESAQRRMEDTREERVLAFQDFTSPKVLSRIPDADTRAFVCGYLASLIAPGSMAHLDLVKRYSLDLPAVLPWYGLCAGTPLSGELLGSFNVLGRRLLRDLLRDVPVWESPLADIAIDELMILSDSRMKPIEFRSFMPSVLEIELRPTISTYVRWSKRDSSRQMDLFSDSTSGQISNESIQEMGTLINQLDQTFKRMAKSLPTRTATQPQAPIKPIRKPSRKRQSRL